MELLPTTNYTALQHLISDAPHDLAVGAIAAGRAAGRVFADDNNHPRFALVSPHWGRLYLLGEAGTAAASAVRQVLEDVIRPVARAAGAKVFTLTYPAGWERYVPQVLRGKPAVQAQRQYYFWAGADYPSASLPAGFTLHSADVDLLGRSGIENLELLRDEMASERSSVDDFLARSFGIVAIKEDQLAGWCLSEYNTDTRCEVGIATLEPFQRRGLAAAMGAAFLDMARSRGVSEVGWHCWKQNIPSATTALKIGLRHVADYPVHFSWYDEAGAPR